jgi:ribonuclease E
MTSHQREVENRLREALHDDRARVQVGRISRFGLLEMSRQRLGPTLAEAIEDICHICHGHGTIRGVASLCLVILRAIEEEAIKENTAQVQAQLPVEVATYLLNEKRKQITQIEQRHNVEVVIIPNQYLLRPHYDVSRVRLDEADAQANISYKLVRLPTELTSEEMRTERRAEPLLKDLRGSSTSSGQPSFFKRIVATLFGENKVSSTTSANEATSETSSSAATVDRRTGRNDRSRPQTRQPRSRNPQGRQRRPDNASPDNRDTRDSGRDANRDMSRDNREPQELSEDARLQRKYADEGTDKREGSGRQDRGPRTQERAERGPRGERPERGSRQRRTPQEGTTGTYTLTNRIMPEVPVENTAAAQTTASEHVSSEHTATQVSTPVHVETQANYSVQTTTQVNNPVHTENQTAEVESPIYQAPAQMSEPASATVHTNAQETTQPIATTQYVREEHTEPTVRAMQVETKAFRETPATETFTENTHAVSTGEVTEHHAEIETEAGAEAGIEDGDADQNSTNYPRRRRPQRPYRGPGRRRSRGDQQQRRQPTDHVNHDPHE